MQRLMTSVAAVVVTLGMASAALANGRPARASHVPVSHPRPVARLNYHLTNGVKFSNGYYYRGIGHRHWSNWYWNKRYGTYFYFDRSVGAYYYWARSAGRYYPVSYIATVPPTYIATPSLVLNGSADTGTAPPPPPDGE
jgi:hypothetical protein